MADGTAQARVISDEPGALAWLFGFADWERGVGWNPNAAPDEAWKLGRTRALLDLAGAPDQNLRIVHIAGTKGKGSTGAYLESIVRAAGWRTGWYSQPHLHTYRERIKLDGRLIAPEAFVRQTERLRGLVERLATEHPEAGEPTTFELTTALAVLAFVEAGIDVAIVEVGLGGRLDATNALHTDLSVITTIGLDHQQILGNTLAEIAGEKAGIVRPGQTVISAFQKSPAARVIRQRCAELGAPLRFVPPLRPQSARAPTTRAQRQNAAVAIATAEALAAFGLPVPTAAVREGLATAWLPARQEVVSTEPLLLIDAAHNVDSARALADTLDQLRPSGALPWQVLGVLGDKDVRGVLRPLLSRAAGVVAATPSSPRALPANDLAAACRDLSNVRVETAESVAAALRLARERAGAAGVVVAGSFVTAAEARAALGLADILTYEDRARWLERGALLAD